MLKSRGDLFLFLGVLSFSFEWYFVREISGLGFSSLDSVFGRLFYSFIGLSVLYLFLRFWRQPSPENLITTTKEKVIIALMGVDAVATNFLFNYSIQKTSVANALVLFYMSIFFGTYLGVLFFRERISVRQIIYSLVAFAGITLALVDRTQISVRFGVGECAALLASITFSFEVIMARGLKHTNFFKRMIGMYFVGSIVSFAIIEVVEGGSHCLQLFLNGSYLMLAALFAVSCGVIGKSLTYLGINEVSVNRALLILLLEPIAQMISAYFIAHESINSVNLIGIGILFVAIYMNNKSSIEV